MPSQVCISLLALQICRTWFRIRLQPVICTASFGQITKNAQNSMFILMVQRAYSHTQIDNTLSFFSSSVPWNLASLVPSCLNCPNCTEEIVSSFLVRTAICMYFMKVDRRWSLAFDGSTRTDRLSVSFSIEDAKSFINPSLTISSGAMGKSWTAALVVGVSIAYSFQQTSHGTPHSRNLYPVFCFMKKSKTLCCI